MCRCDPRESFYIGITYENPTGHGCLPADIDKSGNRHCQRCFAACGVSTGFPLTIYKASFFVLRIFGHSLNDMACEA